MVHIGTFHNATPSLDLRRDDDGRVLIDASVPDLRENAGDVMRDQVALGVRAEELGFDSMFLSEHHLQTAGHEVSTNPLQVQTAIAARTDEIRLGQASCILPWYDPVRFAEQASILDAVSDGRAEIGIGRGYQPREAETMGQYWGGGVQDQAQNRASFEEKYEIVTRAWTEDVFSYDGEYHTIPPGATQWHNDHERAYYESDVSGVELDEVVDWNENPMYATDGANNVVSGGSTLEGVSAYPTPTQEPHPQLWQPAFSPRSIAFAAERGINGFVVGLPDDKLEDAMGLYYRTAEEAGWPDRRPGFDGEPFAYGWDDARNRGVAMTRYVCNTDVATDEEVRAWKAGLVNQWQYYAEFGLLGALAGIDYEEAVALLDEHGADFFVEQGVALVGDGEHIADSFLSTAEALEMDGLNVQPAFEVTGSTRDFVDRQMTAFAEDTAPLLRDAYPSLEADDVEHTPVSAADGGQTVARSPSTEPAASPEAPAASEAPDATGGDASAPDGTDAESVVAGVVARARAAADAAREFSQAEADAAVRAAAWGTYRDDVAEAVATAAVEDTGIGNVADKTFKLKRQTEGALADLHGAESVGVVAEDAAAGTVEVAKPVGVVGALVPSTNPGSTLAHVAMTALKGRNAVVFSPSPPVARACRVAVDAIREQLDAAGYPADLVQILPGDVSKAKARAVMAQVDVLQVTGSEDNVATGEASGTPNYCVGTGNVVSVVDATADVAQAAEDLAGAKPFDDGATCVNPNAVVVESAVAAELRTALDVAGGYHLDDAEAERVRETLFPDGTISRRALASSASDLAAMADVDAGDADFLVVDGDAGAVGDDPLSGEKLSPVLTAYEVPDFTSALDLTERVLDYEGAGHSVTIHSERDAHVDRLAERAPVGRMVVNQHALTLAGGRENGLPYTLSLGGGSWAGNQLDDNLTYEHFLNTTTVARPVDRDRPSRDALFGDYPATEETGVDDLR